MHLPGYRTGFAPPALPRTTLGKTVRFGDETRPGQSGRRAVDEAPIRETAVNTAQGRHAVNSITQTYQRILKLADTTYHHPGTDGERRLGFEGLSGQGGRFIQHFATRLQYPQPKADMTSCLVRRTDWRLQNGVLVSRYQLRFNNGDTFDLKAATNGQRLFRARIQGKQTDQLLDATYSTMKRDERKALKEHIEGLIEQVNYCLLAAGTRVGPPGSGSKLFRSADLPLRRKLLPGNPAFMHTVQFPFTWNA